MKISQGKDNKDESRILIGMIVNDRVLSRIAQYYEGEMFKSKWANIVGNWCVQHYRKYNKAPRKAIETRFEKFSSKAGDKTTVDILSKFLSGLSNEYDSQNQEIDPEHLFDLATEYFNKVRISRLKESLENAIDVDDTIQAEEELSKFKKFSIVEEIRTNPYQEIDGHIRSLEKQREPLFSYPGALKWFFGSILARGNFIAFQGIEKRGKSFWLLDLAHRALMERNKVLFLEIGDMTEDQVMERFQARLCNRPVGIESYRMPIKISRNKSEFGFNRKTKKLSTTKELTIKQIKKAQRRFNETYLRSEKKFFELQCYPMASLSDLELKIKRLQEYEDWKPDVICLDYADLLTGPSHIRDKRERIDENWKRMRALSMELDCLFVTATQADAAAYKKATQDRSNFSDAKQKNAHVTGMIGLNASSEEERKNVTRLNWIVRRRGQVPRSVLAAGCFAIANPAVKSC